MEISGVPLARTETDEIACLGFFILDAKTTNETCNG